MYFYSFTAANNNNVASSSDMAKTSRYYEKYYERLAEREFWKNLSPQIKAELRQDIYNKHIATLNTLKHKNDRDRQIADRDNNLWLIFITKSPWKYDNGRSESQKPAYLFGDSTPFTLHSPRSAAVVIHLPDEQTVKGISSKRLPSVIHIDDLPYRLRHDRIEWTVNVGPKRSAVFKFSNDGSFQCWPSQLSVQGFLLNPSHILDEVIGDVKESLAPLAINIAERPEIWSGHFFQKGWQSYVDRWSEWVDSILTDYEPYLLRANILSSICATRRSVHYECEIFKGMLETFLPESFCHTPPARHIQLTVHDLHLSLLADFKAMLSGKSGSTSPKPCK